MLRLITDFDGPIMDVSERYYRVYQFCLENIKHPQQPIHQLSKAEFWRLKRARVSERKIGIFSGLDETQAAQFAQLRRLTVHNIPYLIYDRLILETKQTLEIIEKLGFDLVVLTMRRTRELEIALKQEKIEKFFRPERRYCLSNDAIKTTDIQDKTRLMEKALKELPSACDVWMVGDTEADMIAAKTHNLKVIGVLSGIRDRKQLEQYHPDFIVNNLAEAVNLITANIAVSS